MYTFARGDKMFTQNVVSRIDKKDNSFILVRMMIALQVFCGHAFAHLNVDTPKIIRILTGLIDGVPLFFGLSGFLIWNSLNRRKSFKLYSKTRILRLYPELVGGGISQLCFNTFCL